MESPKSMEQASPIRVLLIETDKILRDIVRTYLEAWGMTPVACASAAEADAQLAQCDIILMPSTTQEDDHKATEQLTSKGSSARIILGVPLGVSLDSSSASITRLIRPYKQSELYNAIVTSVNGSAHASAPFQTRLENHKRSSTGGRILVAEDNKVNQLLVLNLLRMLGFQAQAVANGREAIQALEEGAFDLVLMDCQMPEMDGFEATDVIRKRGWKIPIIALTANAMSEDKARCLAAGMDDYISKPVRKEALLAVLENCLKNNQAA